MLKGLLLDFDGTLFDSERPHYDALSAVLRRYGHSLTFDEYVNEHVGVSIPDSAKYLVNKHGLTISPEFFANTREEEYFDWLKRNTPEPFPFALEALSIFRGKGLRLGLVSGSARFGVGRTLERYSLEGVFETVVTREDCARAKPFPDLYGLSLQRLQLNAIDCLAVEDSRNGRAAARAAGIMCVLVAHSEAAHRINEVQSFRGFRELSNWVLKTYFGGCHA